jgi:hypothetical protein
MCAVLLYCVYCLCVNVCCTAVLCVLFVCKCVLYCCQWVSTECALYCSHRVSTKSTVLLPPGVNRMCAVLLPPRVNQISTILLPPGVTQCVLYCCHRVSTQLQLTTHPITSCFQPTTINNRPVVALTAVPPTLTTPHLTQFILTVHHQPAVFLTVQHFVRRHICAEMIVILTELSEYPSRWLHKLRSFPIFEWEDKICSGRGYLSAFVFVALWRSNPLSVESNRLYNCVCVCACACVCLCCGGGFEKNVIKGLKTSIQTFLYQEWWQKMTTKKSRTIELVTQTNCGQLKGIRFTLRPKLCKEWDCDRNWEKSRRLVMKITLP